MRRLRSSRRCSVNGISFWSQSGFVSTAGSAGRSASTASRAGLSFGAPSGFARRRLQPAAVPRRARRVPFRRRLGFGRGARFRAQPLGGDVGLGLADREFFLRRPEAARDFGSLSPPKIRTAAPTSDRDFHWITEHSSAPLRERLAADPVLSPSYRARAELSRNSVPARPASSARAGAEPSGTSDC